VIELRRQGFNVLFIPHSGLDFDDILECVKQVDFEDEIIEDILHNQITMEEEIEGKMKILFPDFDQMDFNEKDAIDAKEDNYKESLNDLNNIIERRDKINLLRWAVIKNAPKF